MEMTWGKSDILATAFLILHTALDFVGRSAAGCGYRLLPEPKQHETCGRISDQRHTEEDVLWSAKEYFLFMNIGGYPEKCLHQTLYRLRVRLAQGSDDLTGWGVLMSLSWNEIRIRAADLPKTGRTYLARKAKRMVSTTHSSKSDVSDNAQTRANAMLAQSPRQQRPGAGGQGLHNRTLSPSFSAWLLSATSLWQSGKPKTTMNGLGGGIETGRPDCCNRSMERRSSRGKTVEKPGTGKPSVIHDFRMDNSDSCMEWVFAQ